MKHLPYKSDPIVVRIDFSNQRVWASIRRIILAGRDEEDAVVSFVDDLEFEGLTEQQVMAAVPKEYPQTFLMLVDSISMTVEGHPVLVTSLRKPGLHFRAIAKTISSVAMNLEIANLGFDDFMFGADADGVFKAL